MPNIKTILVLLVSVVKLKVVNYQTNSIEPSQN